MLKFAVLASVAVAVSAGGSRPVLTQEYLDFKNSLPVGNQKSIFSAENPPSYGSASLQTAAAVLEGVNDQILTDMVTLMMNGADQKFGQNNQKRDILPGFLHNHIGLPFLDAILDFIFGQENEQQKYDWLPVAKNENFYCAKQPGDSSNGPSPCNYDQKELHHESYVWTLDQPTNNTNTVYIGVLKNLLCNFGNNDFCDEDGVGGEIYSKSLTSGKLTKITPKSIGARAPRSAECNSEVCIFFVVDPSNELNAIAYLVNATSGHLIHERELEGWVDARASYNLNGRLFFGITTSAGWGAVVEWTGAIQHGEYLQFTVVGDFEDQAGGAANMVYHRGRFYVSTWNNLLQVANGPFDPDFRAFKVMMSPQIQKHAGSPIKNAQSIKHSSIPTSWEEIFDYCEYDTTLNCLSAAGGAIEVYNDQIYFGSMHLFLADIPVALGICNVIANFPVPQNLAPAPYNDYFPQSNLEEFYEDYCAPDIGIPPLNLLIGLSAIRATSLFRFHSADVEDGLFESFEVVYGTYLHIVAGNGVQFTGVVPQYGISGYNNLFNAYTWSMAVYNNELFVGAFDWSLVFNQLIQAFLDVNIEFGTPGFDLIRINGQGRQHVENEALAGHLNEYAYGVRNLLPAKDPQGKDVLFLGTANPFSSNPQGGWELFCLTPKDL